MCAQNHQLAEYVSERKLFWIDVDKNEEIRVQYSYRIDCLDFEIM
jgi:hypothetical protein